MSPIGTFEKFALPALSVSDRRDSRRSCKLQRTATNRPSVRIVLGAALGNKGSLRAFAVKSANDRQWRGALIMLGLFYFPQFPVER